MYLQTKGQYKETMESTTFGCFAIRTPQQGRSMQKKNPVQPISELPSAVKRSEAW